MTQAAWGNARVMKHKAAWSGGPAAITAHWLARHCACAHDTASVLRRCAARFMVAGCGGFRAEWAVREERSGAYDFGILEAWGSD